MMQKEIMLFSACDAALMKARNLRTGLNDALLKRSAAVCLIWMDLNSNLLWSEPHCVYVLKIHKDTLLYLCHQRPAPSCPHTLIVF